MVKHYPMWQLTEQLHFSLLLAGGSQLLNGSLIIFTFPYHYMLSIPVCNTSPFKVRFVHLFIHLLHFFCYIVLVWSLFIFFSGKVDVGLFMEASGGIWFPYLVWPVGTLEGHVVSIVWPGPEESCYPFLQLVMTEALLVRLKPQSFIIMN